MVFSILTVVKNTEYQFNIIPIRQYVNQENDFSGKLEFLVGHGRAARPLAAVVARGNGCGRAERLLGHVPVETGYGRTPSPWPPVVRRR